jgi:hypothetical protein
LANSPARKTQFELLRKADQEVEASGRISPDLMKEILAVPTLGVLWQSFEAEAEQTAQKRRHDIAVIIAEERKMSLSEAKALLRRDPKSLPERKRFVVLETVRKAFTRLAEQCSDLSKLALQNEYQRQLIPSAEKVDKIIRYGNAFERQLRRAYDLLESLQRHRMGEPVLPTVRVRLTQ